MSNQVSDRVPIVGIGLGKGWPQVQGKCPSCGTRSLFLAAGGYVTCAIIRCPNPTVVTDMLDGDGTGSGKPATLPAPGYEYDTPKDDL